MRVLSLVNQKGGCGKTTAAINLAAALAARGRRVLMVDLDPQAHGTLGLGVDPGRGLSLYDVLAEGVSPRSAVLHAPGGIDLIPSSPRLLEFEEVSARMLRPEAVLRAALSELAGSYDDALLDCPARADGVLTANALYASSVVLLVVETGAFALQGALRALELFGEIGERQGSSFDLRVLGTLFDRRTRFARELLVAMQARFGPAMFDTVVRTSVRLREAAAHGVPVRILDPRSRATGDFDALAEEVLAVQLERGAPLEASGVQTLVPLPRAANAPGRPAAEQGQAGETGEASAARHHSRS
jgi:chromosome partitioning protein